MTGTQPPDGKIASDPTSPFVAELQDRQQAIMGGAEPWNDPVELRREARRRHLEIMRTVSVESGVRLNEVMAGRLQLFECQLLKETKDPISSLAKLNISVVQITLAEERLDETVEERSARLAAENAACARSERREASAQDYAQSQIRRSENRQQVRLTVSEITLAKLRLRPAERTSLLNKLLTELDKDPTAYDRDPAAIVAQITSRLGLAPTVHPESKAYFAERRKDLIAGARDHLEAFRDPDTIDDDDENSSAPPAQAQGPPH